MFFINYINNDLGGGNMKLNKELGFIREYPDPVNFPESKISEISFFIYQELINGLRNYFKSSSFYINKDGVIFIDNILLTNKNNPVYYFAEKLRDVKNKLFIDDLFILLGSGGVEFIDFLDGPFIRTYNNYNYFVRYYAFAFGTDHIKHFEVIGTILEYIEKTKVLVDKGVGAKLINKAICLGLKLIEMFNPIQSMKVIQLYYFYGLGNIADHISNIYFNRLSKRFKKFYEANNISYIKKAVELMIDLERVRINISDIYLNSYNNLKEEVEKLRSYMSKLQKR